MKLYLICNEKINDTHGDSGSDPNFLGKVYKNIENYFDISDDINKCDAALCLNGCGESNILEAKNINNKNVFFFMWDYYFGNKFCNIYSKYDLHLKYNIHILTPNIGSKLGLIDDGFKNIYTIPTFAQYFEPKEIKDNNYVFINKREYNFDPSCKWARMACEELNIPYVSHNKKNGDYILYKRKDFQKLISECTLLLNSHFESSTGGMSLLEGFNLGKPTLISNSILNGGNDVLGNFTYKFYYNNYNSLKDVLFNLWNSRPSRDIELSQKFCKENHSVDSFIINIKNVIDNNYDSNLQPT